MGAYVNYFIEANLGLSLLAFVYYLFLKDETDFTLKRRVLLIGILCSLLFPLLRFENQTISAFQQTLPTIWLPELHIGEGQLRLDTPGGGFQLTNLLGIAYSGGVAVFLLLFLYQVYRIVRLMRSFRPVKSGDLLIAEASLPYPSFSFFNFVVIGNAGALSENEKKQIISHESIHVRQYHSFDIMLVNILRIFFWCNPVVHLYKNIFIQLHEFEADSRAVDGHSLDDYCSLLARVALMSADLRIANHFSNSLTLKRIQMMRKIKFRTKPWKIVAMAAVAPVFFFGVACNEETVAEITAIAQETHAALDVPPDVQERFNTLSEAHPDKKYILLEMSGADNTKLRYLEKKYGLPSSMEVFKDNEAPIAGKSDAGVVLRRNEGGEDAGKAYVILEYNATAQKLSDLSSQDNVFTIVENSASFPQGMTAFYNFLADELSYPAEARKAGIQGKVFVEFIVETDGTVSNVSIKKGLHAAIDAEAKRVMHLSPKWNPGTQKGVAVRQMMILPIIFSLGDESGLKKTSSIHDILNPIPPIKPRQEDRC